MVQGAVTFPQIHRGQFHYRLTRRTWVMIRSATVAFVLLVLASPGVSGERPYVTAADLDLTAFLPPPVKAGTEGDRAQQNAVLDAQRVATDDRIALARADAEETVYDMYARTFGPAFNAENLPKMTHLFARVGESEDAAVDPAKPFFDRTRPFLASADIKALVKPSKSGSYPSGHATRVTAVAVILTHMLPERRDVIWARAKEYAESRIVGGMHYPEDIDAGYRAGSALATAIMASPEFKADYPMARLELRAALGLQ
jgi:acid phosphatase (class A)